MGKEGKRGNKRELSVGNYQSRQKEKKKGEQRN